jgi:heat shock protein HtpX
MWTWAKRITLFLLVNFLIMIMISIVLNLLGVRPYLSAQGIDYQSLMVFCFVWGMGGALISLALSRVMAKWIMGVQVIDPSTRDPRLQELVETVQGLARSAGLPMPQVGIYSSPEINAFATGPSKRRSLVAVSSGLLARMGRSEMEGVLGHELSHVANGDMVTLTLIQGVVNAFVLFLSRVIAFAVSQAMRGERDDRSAYNGTTWVLTMILDMVLGLFGSMVVAAFSRWREFRADAGGARLAGRDSMIGALQALKRTYELEDPRTSPAIAAFKISSRRGSFLSLLSTHPSLDERIERLELMRA